MADEVAGDSSLGRRIAADNGWMQLGLGLGLPVLAFVLGGWKPTLAVVIFLLVVTVVALGLSLKKAHDQLAERPPERPPTGSDAPTPSLSGSLEPDSEEHRSGQSSEILPTDERKGGADDDSDAIETDVDTPDSPWREVLDAAFDRDVVRTVAAAERFVAEADNEKERITRQAWGLRMRSLAGEVQAVPQLERLIADHPGAPDPALSLAESLKGLGEYERAVAVLEGAAPNVSERRSFLLAEASRIIRGHGDMGRAEALADEALRHAVDDVERGKAQQEKGWALWEDDQKFAAFTAWENALRCNPSNDTLRFALAYRYADTDLEELAMWHYELLIARSPTHPSARNNLGVVLTDLDMRFKAADFYRTAVEQGESLAASNMAWLMITAGCGAEAEEWLAKGREGDDVHPNIDRAAGRLADFREHEDETHTAAEVRAQALRDLFTQGLAQTELPTGRWKIGDDDVELVEEGEGASVERTDFGMRYGFVRDDSGLNVAYKAAQYAPDEKGMGVCRDGVLRFYLRSSSGTTRLVTGHPAPDADPPSD